MTKVRIPIQCFSGQVSISPKFYEHLFCTSVFCTAFKCLQFGFVIFWQKEVGAKAARKMLVKLTLGLNSYLAILVFLGLILFVTTNATSKAKQSFLTTTLISSTFFFVTVPSVIIIKNDNLKTFMRNQLCQTKFISFGRHLISLLKNCCDVIMGYNKTSPVQ